MASIGQQLPQAGRLIQQRILSERSALALLLQQGCLATKAMTMSYLALK
ncbi:MAG: hypothetical protein H6823_09590 [Planctomycetaceae bacterium]|nr:hypothetical protein [Planctomycetaceae bacterium]